MGVSGDRRPGFGGSLILLAVLAVLLIILLVDNYR
jgi:hypothetical protein